MSKPEKLLLVLAGNHKQYIVWTIENRKALKRLGYATRFISPYCVDYRGYDQCDFIRVGTWHDGEFQREITAELSLRNREIASLQE